MYCDQFPFAYHLKCFQNLVCHLALTRLPLYNQYRSCMQHPWVSGDCAPLSALGFRNSGLQHILAPAGHLLCRGRVSTATWKLLISGWTTNWAATLACILATTSTSPTGYCAMKTTASPACDATALHAHVWLPDDPNVCRTCRFTFLHGDSSLWDE